MRGGPIIFHTYRCFQCGPSILVKETPAKCARGRGETPRRLGACELWLPRLTIRVRSGDNSPNCVSGKRTIKSTKRMIAIADSPQVVCIDDSTQDTSRPRRPVQATVRRNQNELFPTQQRMLINMRQRRYREKQKSNASPLEQNNREARRKIGGSPKKSMRAHQYTLFNLKRIIAAGTRPAARWALSPPTDILSYVPDFIGAKISQFEPAYGFRIFLYDS